MKALVLESYNNLVYKDVKDPIIGDNDVLIQVKAVGICGSDVRGMDGRGFPLLLWDMRHRVPFIVLAIK